MRPYDDHDHDMHCPDWPLCANSIQRLSALEGRGDYRSIPQNDVEEQPTPQPPSTFSAEDYRSILKSQSPFSNSTVDEYVLGLHSHVHSLPTGSYHPPPLAPRACDISPLASPTFKAQQQLLPSINFASHYSPSLSSSITTIPSSPESPELQSINSWPFSEVTAQLEPLRTKRKFSSLRTAKRLPRRQSPPWEVHALIQVRTSDLPGKEFHPNNTAPGAVTVTGEPSEQAAAATGLGLHTSGTGINIPGLNLKISSSEQWSSSFIHYRGASFEVINPHASLLYGSRSFETPAAEIDGLLDDYFDLSEQLEKDMDRSASSTSGDTTPSRQLYDDPEIARRNILGLRFPQAGGLNVAGDIGNSSEQTPEHRNSEAEIDEIVDGYDHTTYPPTRPRPESTQSSDTDFVLRLHGVHEESPDIPILIALKRSNDRRRLEQEQRAAESRQLAEYLRAGNNHDMPTSERTYGDTNRLLGISPYSAGLSPDSPVGPNSRESTPRQPSIFDGAFAAGAQRSVATHITSHAAGLRSRRGSIHGGDTPPATPQPPVESDTSTTSLSTVIRYHLHDQFDNEDLEHDADWVTDHEDDAVPQQATRESHASSQAGLSTYRAYVEHSQAIASPPRPAGPDPAEVEEVFQLLSLRSRLGSQLTGSANSIAVHSTTAQQYRRTADQAYEKLAAIKADKPDVFQRGVDKYIVESRSLPGAVRPARENGLAQVPRRTAAFNTTAATTIQAVNKSGRSAGLDFSPSTGSFATVRRPGSPVEAASQGNAGAGSRPARPARGAPAPAPPRPSEWQSPETWREGPSKQQERTQLLTQQRIGRAMASMSSQTGLRDLHLTSTPTSNLGQSAPEFSSRSNTPLYPRQMRFTTPTIRPSQSPRLARPARTYRPSPQPDVELVVLAPPTLLPTPTSRPVVTTRDSLYDMWVNPGPRIPETQSQELLSRNLWNPFALLLIWGGCYDKKIRRSSRGAVMRVNDATKLEAIKWAFLEFAIIVIIGSLVTMFALVGSLAHS